MKPTTQQAEAGAINRLVTLGDSLPKDAAWDDYRAALQAAIDALTRKGGEAVGFRFRVCPPALRSKPWSDSAGVVAEWNKPTPKNNLTIEYQTLYTAQPDQAELVTYWIGRHGDLKKLLEKILQPPGGDSFSGWSAWLIDHSRMFDPYIQAPYAKLLADWLASLDVIAAAPRPVGGDGEGS